MLPFVFAAPGAMFGISPWAICVVAAGWIAMALADCRARAQEYDRELLRGALTWIVVTGFVFGHVLDELFYHRELLADPASLVRLFRGQSSCGGFLGAVAGAWMWSRVLVQRRGLRLSIAWRRERLPLLPVAEILCATFPLAWAVARLGCALIHDHPGRSAPAGSWLAVAWPTGPADGVQHALGPLRFVFGSASRYDLGLLECGFTLVLALALAATWRRRHPLGFYSCAVCLAYAPARFALDFLRVEGVPDADPRYASLTFAQWFCLAMFAYGVRAATRLRQGGA